MEEKIKKIKGEFYCYRNGVVADTLRKAGFPQKIIFGVEIPRLSAIAREYGPDPELAAALWADSEVRESRLLAAWLFDPATISETDALRIASEARTREEADMLAFRLFKRMHNPGKLLRDMEARDECSLCAKALAPHLEQI